MFKCPKCGRSDEIDIAATVWVRLIDNPGDPDHLETDADDAEDHSHEWNDASPSHCCACGWSGTVADFNKEKDT